MNIRYSETAREAVDDIPRNRLFGHPDRPETWLVLTPEQARWVEERPGALSALAPYRMDPER